MILIIKLEAEDKEMFKDAISDLVKHLKKQMRDLKKLQIVVENIDKKLGDL